MLKKLDQSIRTLNQQIDRNIMRGHASMKSRSQQMIQLFKHHQPVLTSIRENDRRNNRPSHQSSDILLNKEPVVHEEVTQDDTYLLLDGLLVTKDRLSSLKVKGDQWNVAVNVDTFPAITQKYVFKRCERCLNEDSTLFLSFPCGKCHKTDWYCLNCLTYGRITTCQTLYHLRVPARKIKPLETGFQFTSILTPHQQQASDRLMKAIKTGERHLLIHAVCGAGKTEMLFHGINDALKSGKRVAVSTPRQDVIKELLPRFQAVFTSVQIVCQYGGSDDNSKQAWLTLCTTHQLIRYKAAFDVLIIDEVDAFPYHHDQSLIKQSKRALKSTGTFIYLSATPRQALVKKRYPTCFVPVRYHGHPLPVPEAYFTRFKNTPLPRNIKEAITHQRENNRQLLLFVATIKQANTLLPYLQTTFKNLTIEAVHASSDERKQHIDQFRLTTIDVLVTTTILERGVTFPSVDVFVLQADHDVFDEAALVQIAGRAGRSKNDPTGSVHFYFETYTKAIRKAIKAIKQMNALGEKL